MNIPQPPKLSDYREGTRLVAGVSHVTILADMDFETYSPAGYVWDDVRQKFTPPHGAAKYGLQVVGAAVYSEHPDAEVLSLAYNLKDGRGPKLWTPNDPLPKDLFAHIHSGGLIEAWNVAFEHWIWVNICMPKYHFPKIDIRQLRCAAAKARAFALPGSLANAGDVLGIQNKKDKDGTRLINKFCMPKNPTRSRAEKRNHLLPNDPDVRKLYDYNLRDIEAEAEISSIIPDLSPEEQEFWFCDRTINYRGVQVDIDTIQKAIAIIETAYAQYTNELQTLTGGAVKSVSEVAKLIAWMREYGVFTNSLDKENVEALLKINLPDDVRRALEIRQLISASSVKKLYALTHHATKKGRVHDLFLYHSARTGRAAGAGPQPQNFPNSGPEVYYCTCGKHYSQLTCCPWCGCNNSFASSAEWNQAAVEEAIELIKTGDLNCVQYYYPDAIDVISGCLRAMFISAPAHDLICSDYSAIEAVVLAALAGEEWRLEVFRTHGKIYEMSASKITGVPFEEFIKYKEQTGQHHPLRKKVGKVAELACLAHDTQVLTGRGYVNIVDVLTTDKLWDGVQWVNHGGVIHKGKKQTLVLDGVRMTPNHPISLGDSWRAAEQLALNENTLYRALEIASENLPISVNANNDLKEVTASLNAVVHAAQLLPPRILTYALAVQRVATNALKLRVRKLLLNGLKIIGRMQTSYLTFHTGAVYAGVFPPQSLGAIQKIINHTQTTEEGALLFSKNGEKVKKVKGRSLNILQPLKVGIMKCWRWTGLMSIKAMSLAISNFLHAQKIKITEEKLRFFKTELNTLSDVYDIVNAGPRNRFTIKTNSGHLIVHNSGYAGWIGAWKNFGAEEFFTEDEMKKAILAWRDASPAIVKMWGGQKPYCYGIEGAAISAVQNPHVQYESNSIKYYCANNVLYCFLPSGRYLTYHAPHLSPSERKQGTLELSYETWNTNPIKGPIGWHRVSTYGGKLVENVVQAVARDILAHAIVNLERAGYPIVLHVHDEIVAEVPESFGSLEEFEKIMSTMPAWAISWPIKATGGWRGKRYRK